MPRKPNYAFERMERDRAKAQKLAEKAAAAAAVASTAAVCGTMPLPATT